MIHRPAFLLDEHVWPDLADALRRVEPGILVFVIGQAPAPPRGTPDPDLLLWLEEHHCILVTNDRRTMPHHLADHLAAGHHVFGILELPRHLVRWRIVIDDLILIWAAGRPDDFADRIEHLPL